MANLIYKDEVYAIIGAAMEVYNALGSGFLEGVYQEALEIESIQRAIPVKAQQEIVILYKGRRLKKFYIADFVAYGKIIIEIKAISKLGKNEEAQLINYLKATGMEIGVLINFGSSPDLEWKRMMLTKKSHSIRENPPEYEVQISED
ncbi:MAG: NADH:ubiquinone oxidoreductase [Anaerolineaceae bacterium 4572_5.1]|nr:MAG: NADH:ubiquinone oxidoreductase [Anaerolineaceae bacterium 4572_5.1]